MDMIVCSNISHSYDTTPVLHDLNLSIKEGKIVGLLGKNGAGKSTTINILMGFLRPSAGSCSVFGHPSHAIPPDIRRDIGLLHEGFIQYDFMTIGEIERFYSRLYPNWNKHWYFELINRMHVPHTRKITRLSCGQRSQVVLGLILAQQPRLMILDDYSMGLDVGYRRLFLELLREYVNERKTTVLLTSHIVQELETLVDEVVILQRGKVLASGALREVLGGLYQYAIPLQPDTLALQPDEHILNVERHTSTLSLYSHTPREAFGRHLSALGYPDLPVITQSMNLEDAFVGLTGRY